MTRQQFDKLTEHKHVYDFYLQVQTINSAHPSVYAINDVIKEMRGTGLNLSCGACVIDGLNAIYNEYEQFKTQTQL